MRTLIAAVTAGAVLAPWAGWNPPVRRSPSAPELELPERVFNAITVDQRPFDCRWCCDNNRLQTAFLVRQNALWIGSNTGDAHWIRRDGREWGQVGPALRSLVPDLEDRDVQVALDEGAVYEDLLAALLAARDAGFEPRVVQPGVPVRWRLYTATRDPHEC